ncbi:hypothetical protein [Sinanaerobacter sp. ZZT-01]|uniref:hypothetical protein n=1 Tax=Sinanaerobacter sp. ZZT-01 TaxID=3111540 RepID=UPI002D788DCB|nr:hypothetical protein [Sinanaerobacter sp. ZZT-01]WRR93353.1 hypothetical protein U5921_15185 [Sinanaerobacter sp. ZZT-01]
MKYEKKYEAQIIGQSIGEEIRKMLEKSNRQDDCKEYRERDEYGYKRLLYSINISAIISYIAGALVMQLPFIDKFGIMQYDFKLYLLFGSIVFVIIQIALFILSIYEQLVSWLSSEIECWVINKLENYEFNGLDNLIRIVIFIPISLILIDLCGNFLELSLPENYKDIIPIIVLFFRIYISLSLVFQDKRFDKNMNTNNFVFIIVALFIALYTGRASFEQYLLTDAKIINNHIERPIELLLIDGKSVYYKEKNTYKYEILKENITIEFLNNSNQ